jgi:hypothetical protein
MKRIAWTALLICTLCAGPSFAGAQEAPAEEAEKQDYVSVRIDVYSRHFRTVAEHGLGVKLKVAISAGIYRYETLDEFLDRDTEHLNAAGVRPKLEFEYPTPVRNVSFVPDLELSLNRTFDTSSRVLAGAARAAFLYRKNGDDRDLKVKMGVKYGSQYEKDGLNFDDYVETNLRVDLKRWYGFKMGSHRLTVTPFGEIKYFVDDLEFETEGGALFDVDRHYELGFEFNTDPRKKIWGIAMPRLKISYAFGDDFRGIKIRL